MWDVRTVSKGSLFAPIGSLSQQPALMKPVESLLLVTHVALILCVTPSVAIWTVAVKNGAHHSRVVRTVTDVAREQQEKASGSLSANENIHFLVITHHWALKSSVEMRQPTRHTPADSQNWILFIIFGQLVLVSLLPL